MIRKHETPYSWQAGLLAFGVHAILLVAMVVSVNWKAAHPQMVATEVTLWDAVPVKTVAPPPKPMPTPEPEIKKAPEPEPVPKVEEKPVETPKVDIVLEKKKQEEKLKLQKQQEEKQKQEKLKQLQALLREDALKPKSESQETVPDSVKQALREEELNGEAKSASAANASLVNEYQAKIAAKIRGHVNKTLCGNGNPVLHFNIDILPTGDLSSSPKLAKSSGNSVCDDAVERAIMASQPLPLPPEPSARAQFRNILLKFYPNE